MRLVGQLGAYVEHDKEWLFALKLCIKLLTHVFVYQDELTRF